MAKMKNDELSARIRNKNGDRQETSSTADRLSGLIAEVKELKRRLSTSSAEVERLKKENEALKSEIKKLEQQQAETVKAVTEFLEVRTEKLIDRHEQVRAAQPYADLLYKWIPALQDLMGLSRALDDFPNAELREHWAERYLQGVKRMRLEASEEKDSCAEKLRAAWEEARKSGPVSMLQWWKETEDRIEKGGNILQEGDLVKRLLPRLEKLKPMGPAECLSARGLYFLRVTADLAEEGLRRIGLFPEFYGSPQTQEEMDRDPVVAAVFNRGNSAGVEIPAVFLKRDGKWELLSGCVGSTLLK